jgi:lipopolysaccharide heptosyltransferase II
MKILIIALSGIGDALIFTPALKLLRKEKPNAKIDVLTMINGVKDIYSRNPNINEIIYFNFLNEGFLKSLGFLFGLRGKYDATINVYPSNRKEYNIINFIIGAPNKVAVRYLRKHFQNFGWLNNVTIKESDSLHNAQTNIKLIEKLLNKKFDEAPAYDLFLNSDDETAAAKYLFENNISENDLVIGFHPGTATLKNQIKRRWEPEKFSALGNKLINKHGAKILIFGGPDEKDLKENIRDIINSNHAYTVLNLSLPQSAAVMKRCKIFVTNDSSLMHVASALNLNTVAIIGPTNRNYIHPWRTNFQIASLNLDCSPCFIYSPRPLKCFRNDVKFKCIKELTVEMVYKEVIKFI